MESSDQLRRRLAALDVGRVRREKRAPGTALIACRSLEGRLRELKREVLRDLHELRDDVHQQGRRAFGKKPTAKEMWRRRDEGARKLLADVRARVIGKIEDDDVDAIEVRSEIRREIDARLEELEQLEVELAAKTGEELPPIPGRSRSAAEEEGDDELYARAGADAPPPRPAPESEPEGEDDDLYARVGAAVQEGERGDAHCPHCGRAIEDGDRFCRRCGHRLGSS